LAASFSPIPYITSAEGSMTELIPYVFLILAAGLAGICMRMMLEYKKRAARFERDNLKIRRRRDEHVKVVEELEGKIKELENQIDKNQTDLTSLQMIQREATTHLTELEEKQERLNPSSRRVATDREQQ
jgi:TolA-binding protein